MSYTKLFELDNEYKAIVNEYKVAKHDFMKKVNYGAYNKDYLLGLANDIVNDLSKKVSECMQKKIEETKAEMNRLKNSKGKIGYAERQAEAKEFEIGYKLADNHELKAIVNDLHTTDLLELSLLRMELKSRNMDNEERQVKAYISKNKLDGMDEIEQKEYDNLQRKLAIYTTMGTNSIVIDGELKPIKVLDMELQRLAVESQKSS